MVVDKNINLNMVMVINMCMVNIYESMYLGMGINMILGVITISMPKFIPITMST